MIDPGVLLAAALAVPTLMLVACMSARARTLLPSLLALAPVPALMTALLAYGGESFALPHTPLRMTLEIDRPAALLLGAVALLWIAAGAYVPTYLRDETDRAGFSTWWLLTLIGNLGVFIAGDLVTFYLVFAFVSLAAFGLIVRDGTESARRAGFVYVSLGLFGEACLLMGFVRLAAGTPGDSLMIRDVIAALPTSPGRDATLLLLIVGFGLKIGLVPLHVWIPLAHSASPLPVSVVLSGAVVKAGLIGLIRFLPFGDALPEWGNALAVVGLSTAYYGVLVGITQANPKSVLAYSTMSQMGVIGAVLGMALASGDNGTAFGASFYALHHVLVKGALFLAVGVVAATASRRLWPVATATLLLGLSLGGLPLTGGALAKAAVKAPLGEGIVGVLATFSATGTTLLMLHFLNCLVPTARSQSSMLPSGLFWPWLAISAAAFVLPWVVQLATGFVQLSDVLSLKAIWGALWPVIVGSGLAVAMRRWGERLPLIPIGDIAVYGTGAVQLAHRCGDQIERIEGSLRRWPVAGASLLALTVLFSAVLLRGR